MAKRKRSARRKAMMSSPAQPGGVIALPSASRMMAGPAKPSIDLGRQSREQRFNPMASLTPVKLGQALESFHAGFIRDAALIWDALESRVDIIAACAIKRKSDIARRPWEVVQLDKSEEAGAHKEALEDFFNHITVSDATDLNVTGGMALLIRQMMGAQLQKYAVHEIVWSVRGERFTDAETGAPGITSGMRAELKFVPLYLFENRRGRLAYAGINGYSEGALCQPGEWVITCGRGIMEAVSVAWMFRSLSLKDWIGFSEKFGMPGVHMEINAAKGSPEWDVAAAALENFANEWTALTSTGAKINLIETGKTGAAPFKPMVDYCDRMIATLFRGADLSTISSKDGTGASLQGDESAMLQQDDCELVSESINLHLTRAVIRHTFGEGVEPLAYVQVTPEKPRDTKLDMEVDKHLVEMGVPISQEDIAERLDRTIPDEDETLVEAKAEKKPEVRGQRSDADLKAEGGRRKAEGEKKDDDDDDDALENDMALEDEQAAFLNSCRELIATSRITDHASLITDLTEILGLDNEAEQDRRMAEFITALPESIGADAKQVEAWEAVIASALVNGFADVGNTQSQS